MRPLINLASDPFRNRRIFWLLVSLIVFSASLVGLNILSSKARLENQIALLEPIVKRLEDKAKNGEEPNFDGSSLSVAQNQALLAAQDLINRKGFSWSQLLNDLEQHIPANVRVTRITVDKISGASKAKDNPANEARSIFLSFDAVGKSASAMTQMIGDMNRAAKFSVNPKAVRPVDGTEEVEFQLEVEYRPSTFVVQSANNSQIAVGEVRK